MRSINNFTLLINILGFQKVSSRDLKKKLKTESCRNLIFYRNSNIREYSPNTNKYNRPSYPKRPSWGAQGRCWTSVEGWKVASETTTAPINRSQWPWFTANHSGKRNHCSTNFTIIKIFTSRKLWNIGLKISSRYLRFVSLFCTYSSRTSKKTSIRIQSILTFDIKIFLFLIDNYHSCNDGL